MKRKLVIVGALLFVLSVCQGGLAATLKVGATPVPHAEILERVVPILSEQGITLEIVEFTDYVRPNLALQDGDLDANFFQHVPYLESFNEDAGTDLVSLAGIHIEPLGVFSEKLASLDELPARASIAIPNDATNGGRALLLLQEAGLISLDPAAGITPTVFDITANERQLRFVELEAAQLVRSLPDVHAAVINGNYALQADLNPIKDAIFLEGAESPYVNIIAVRAGDTERADLQQLVQALLRDEIRQFILDEYQGAVVPVF
ncbi:MAG: MetQ/NlpA family ABC transporter substrate-binding protein [Limnochordia bacterium]|jgi:D-methionine transport system substrate-binding protein|nr:MetQ/NlpA family ABC transporter substrate-binding protein [Bacillota bacterium]NLL07437.1 ABC transporter substrate-binding protein [Bacillota bacterium]